MGFTWTVAGVVAQLRAAGLQAASDTRDLNPPGVLVTPAVLLSPDKLCGTGRLRLFLDLVARDAGDTPALAQLEDLHDQVAPLVADRRPPGDEATFTRRNLGSDPTGLPTLRVTIVTPITEPPPTPKRSTP